MKRGLFITFRGDNVIDLKQGDCLELMKEIPDKSVDMVLCDLPYGKTANQWDNVLPFEKLWEQYNRIIKEDCSMLLFAQEPFASKLRMSNLPNYKYDWIWNKTRGSNPFVVHYMPAIQHECVLNFCNSTSRERKYYPIMEHSGRLNIKHEIKNHEQYSTNYNHLAHFKYREDYDSSLTFPKSIITFSNRKEKRFHPTQKPVALLEYLIKTYTKENDIVLDNCMGSGSTGVACVNTKRDFIGMELDEKYFHIAEKRIQEAQSEIRLDV